MSRYASILMVLSVLVAVPTEAAAQDLDSICSEFQETQAGEWAEYQMNSPQGSGTMRMALLSEGAAGDEGQWFEISGEMNGQNNVIQLLVGDWPYSPQDVAAVVVKAGGQPAMRVPDQMVGQMRNQMATPIEDLANACERSELLESGSIEVPAGTFEAHRIRPPADVAGEAAAESEVWLSTDVPFGIVKSEGSEGSMVLIGMGDDATSTITETPGDMPGMPGMGAP